jgi:hypothetical protein
VSTPDFKTVIQSNAAEVTRLNKRIHETVRHRGTSAQQKEEWRKACAEFHTRYDQLAFPGGYDGASERLLAGDQPTIEAALCFLEVRPYFFRSGYMYQELLRKIKRAPLTPPQQGRLEQVVARQAAWKASRAAVRP